MRRKLKMRRKAFLLCLLSLMIVLPTSVLANLSVSENGQVKGTASTFENELVNETMTTNPETDPVVDEVPVPDKEEQPTDQPSGDVVLIPAPEATKDEVLPPAENEQQAPVNQIDDTPITTEYQDEKTLEQIVGLSQAENTDKATVKRGENADKPFNSLLAAEGGLTTADLSTGITPEQLVEKLVGDDIEISNVTFTGINHSSGTFNGGADIIGFDDGVILSNGDIANVIGPNDNDEASSDNGTGGDEDLNQLVPDFELNDAAVLEFDFIPTHDTLRFRYVFSSDEYNEYVDAEYNDVFGFFVNSQNIALIPETNLPVSIHNINLDTNSQYFINNEIADEPEPTLAINPLLAELLNTQMDGLTVVMTATTTVNIGEVNHIKLAIADASDASVDSNVFIEAGSFSSIDTKAPVKPEVLEVDDNDQALTGTTESGATVIVKIGETEIGNNKADASGKFSISIPKQQSGTILDIFAIDEAGNISEPTKVTVLDKTPPVMPNVNKVTDQDIIVSGQTENNAKVEVKVNGTIIGTGTAGEDGKFAVTILKQAGGTTLVITATDSAGNVSEAASVVVAITSTATPTTTATELPDTATNNFNLLFAGLSLVMIGGARLIFRRKEEE